MDVINERTPGHLLGFHIHNRIACIEILFPLDFFHGGHELFHQSTHEIDRCKQPDDLDHAFIMPKSTLPDQTVGVGRLLRQSPGTTALKEAQALGDQNGRQAVFPWSHCRSDQRVLDEWF